MKTLKVDDEVHKRLLSYKVSIGAKTLGEAIASALDGGAS